MKPIAWNIVAVLALSATVQANPTAPQLGGTWNSSAIIGSDYTNQTSSLGINAGVSVTVSSVTTIAVKGTFNWYDSATGTGTLNNYGTLDFTGFNGRFVQNGTPTINNFGDLLFGDLTDPRCYGAFVLNNVGTIAKTAGTGSAALFTQTAGTINNFYVDGGGATNGGTIRVEVGTLALGGQTWNFGGNQTIAVAAGATFSAPDAANHYFGGTWTGTGGGVIKWVGGDSLKLDSTGRFTLNIDDGIRTNYTSGGAQLGSGSVSSFTFRANDTKEDTVINAGKFWMNLAGRWQSATYKLNFHNQGWLIWDANPTTSDLQYAVAGSELRNLADGVIEVLSGTRSGGGNPITVTLNADSTFRRSGTNSVASWRGGIGRFNIENGATIEVVTNTLSIYPGAGATQIYFGGANTAIATQNFNVVIHNSATLDLRNIAAAGITTVGAGATVEMRGSGKFLNDTTDVLSNKLVRVNGTLRLAESFVLTPGGGELTVNNGGTISGNGTVRGKLTLAAGANFRAQINTTDASSEVLFVTDLSLGANPTLVLADLGGNQTLAQDTKLTLIDYSGDWNGGTFAGYADDSEFTFGANEYRINYNDGGGALTLTVIPEPSTLMLVGAGLLGMLVLRCRR